MHKHLSLRSKVAITIILIGLIVGLVNAYQIIQVRKVDAVTDSLISQNLKRIGHLGNTHDANEEIRRIYTYPPTSTEVATATSKRLATQKEAYLSLISADADNTLDRTLIDQYKNASSEVESAVVSVQKPDALSRSELLAKTEKLDKIIVALFYEENRVIVDKKKIVEEANQEILNMLVLMTIGVTVAAGTIGFILMTSIARSLAKIQAGANRIANGDFSAPLEIESNDELGKLGQSFNSMSKRLQDSYRRLAVEQQRDEAILQGMGEGLVATDEKGRVLIINHIGADYLRVPDIKGAIGKPVEDVYKLYDENAPNDSKPLHKKDRPVYTALSSAKPLRKVYAFYKSDGKKALLDITATPITLDNKVVGVISIMRDVTKEKEIDRMKTEFISLASHQLRTPLSAIKWFTEMLIAGDAGKLTADQMEFAKNIDDSTTRMIALVNALLNISRIESGRIMIDPKPTDLHELVGGIVNDLKAKTEEKKQTLIISVHDELPKINLDPRLISQVYLNLLSNAIKYTQKGGEISVFISRKGDDVISQVTDNGYGIPKEQQGKLFQKFFRAANAVKVETDGTGLGLYLIKSVIESSGGKIWFESEEDKGSTFWFSIPLSGMKAKEGEVTLDV